MEETKEAREEAVQEAKEEAREEKIIEKRKAKLFHFFKKKENIWLCLILLAAILIRIYFFVQVGNQPIWWDEADYLIKARYYATGLERFNDFSPRKPLLMSIFWAGTYMLGANEFILRLTELIFSLAGIYLTYLVGKKLFNAKVGLIAAALLSVWWSHLFYTYRLLLDIPIIVFTLASIYFFHEWYEKQKIKPLLICGIITALGIIHHYFIALLPVTYLLFLVLTKREIFKTKKFWIAVLIGLLALSPFLIWMGIQFGNPLHSFVSYFQTSALVDGCDEPYPCGWGGYLSNFPGLFGLQLFIFFIIGFAVLLVNLFLSFDFIIKEKDKKYRWDFFILITLVIIFSFLTTVMGNFEDRYMFMITPGIFFIMAQGATFIYDQFKKYSKIIVILAITALFIWGAYAQLDQASNTIMSKSGSYLQVKQAGDWLKENVDDNSVILTTSHRHLLYYSEKNVFLLPYVGEEFAKDKANDCWDMANLSYYTGKLVEKEEPKSLDFIKRNEISNCYVALTVFEPSSPQWVFSWPQEQPEDLEPLQGWFFDAEQQQPAVILYKLNR